MRRRLSLLFGITLLLSAAAASACNICVPYTCPDPEMWWECAQCDEPPPGQPGSIYCAMWPDGSCATGSISCTGYGSTAVTPTYRVAAVRVLTPGVDVHIAKTAVAVAQNRDTAKR